MNFFTPGNELIEAIQDVLDRNALSNWECDAGDSLWQLTRKLPDKETVGTMIREGRWFDLKLRDVEHLRELSDTAGEWAHARDGKPLFVDNETWEQMHDLANRPLRYQVRRRR